MVTCGDGDGGGDGGGGGDGDDGGGGGDDGDGDDDDGGTSIRTLSPSTTSYLTAVLSNSGGSLKEKSVLLQSSITIHPIHKVPSQFTKFHQTKSIYVKKKKDCTHRGHSG